jgi:hypothetical protein
MPRVELKHYKFTCDGWMCDETTTVFLPEGESPDGWVFLEHTGYYNEEYTETVCPKCLAKKASR